ncbi:hypothetical protein [Paenibacillus illinoisensis]|uniref:hypothetical protein n=1 Tax=Paenibacillus illinoisensis TaxID=59845 RepID=UPI00301D3325
MFFKKKRPLFEESMSGVIAALNAPKVHDDPPKLRIVTDCDCSDKYQEWSWDESLGCWYVERECERCEYYWEGPMYLYDDPDKLGNTLD